MQLDCSHIAFPNFDRCLSSKHSIRDSNRLWLREQNEFIHCAYMASDDLITSHKIWTWSAFILIYFDDVLEKLVFLFESAMHTFYSSEKYLNFSARVRERERKWNKNDGLICMLKQPNEQRELLSYHFILWHATWLAFRFYRLAIDACVVHTVSSQNWLYLHPLLPISLFQLEKLVSCLCSLDYL